VRPSSGKGGGDSLIGGAVSVGGTGGGDSTMRVRTVRLKKEAVSKSKMFFFGDAFARVAEGRGDIDSSQHDFLISTRL
jgi:hypothetical protein